MLMRLRQTDRPPTLDPTVPEVQAALDQIRIELAAVQREHPEMTPRQQLQEARRRCAGAMVAVVDVIEAKRYGLELKGRLERPRTGEDEAARVIVPPAPVGA